MVKKYKRIKKTRRSYSYMRNGKRITVPAGKQRYRVRNPKLTKKISLKEAKKVHEKRTKRSKNMDEPNTSRKMFAVPHRSWARRPGRSDLWGIDGFNAPEVKKKPETGKPFQVVKYDGIVYVADGDGDFRPQLKVKPLDAHDEKNIKEFEERTGRTALKEGSVTDEYFEWLNEIKEPEMEQVIADRLSVDDRNWGKKGVNLLDIRDLYNQLDVSDEDMKDIFLHMANNHYSGEDAKSFTKRVKKYHDHIYHDTLLNMIERAKKGTPDPADIKRGENMYIKKAKQGRGLPFRNVQNILNSEGYGFIGPDQIRDRLKSRTYKSGKTDIARDIANDLMKEFKAGEQTDTDVVDAEGLRETGIKEAKADSDFYSKSARDQYIDYLIKRDYSEQEIKELVKDYKEKGKTI